MKANLAVILYNPGTDEIAVGRFGDDDFRQRTRHLRRCVGAVFVEIREMKNFFRSQAQVLADFITITVHDKVDAAKALEEFAKIDEFRDALPDEMLPSKYWPERHAQNNDKV